MEPQVPTPKVPQRKRLDASQTRQAARVGQATNTSRKLFEKPFEELPEALRKQLATEGFGGGDIAEVEYQFTWSPWGWGAGRQWTETAMRTSDTPTTASYVLGLNAIVKTSNFGLEEQKYEDIDPDVMEWVLGEVGFVERKADPKKSSGSGAVAR